MTFHQLNGQVYPQVIESSRGKVAVEPSVKDFVSYSRERGAAKVARCRAGASPAKVAS